MEGILSYTAFRLLDYIWQLSCYILFAVSSVLSFSGKSTSLSRDKADVNRQMEYILDEYGNSILRLAYSYVHNMSDAEDILQDTLVQFIKTAPLFENGVHAKAWLLKVASNISKNRISYNRLRITDELNEELIAEEREDLSFVWDAVKSLPDKYREVIHLFYYEGYTTAHIAKILKQNDSTTRSLLNRGRSKLKEILKEEYDFDEIS